jgi:hypothetical protein
LPQPLDTKRDSQLVGSARDHARGFHDLIGWEVPRTAMLHGRRTAVTLDAMSQLVRMLLGEKVVIGSPLPPGEARDRLRAAKAAFDEDGYRIAGRIAERRITVSIRQASIRSSWIQILRRVGVAVDVALRLVAEASLQLVGVASGGLG